MLATAEIPNSYFFVKLFVWFSFYASFCNSDHFMGTRGDHMAPSSLWGNTYNLSSLYSSKIQKYQSYSSKIPKYLLLKLFFLNTKLNHILIKVCFRNHKGITYSNLIILVFKIWTWRKILDLVFVKLSYNLTHQKKVFSSQMIGLSKNSSMPLGILPSKFRRNVTGSSSTSPVSVVKQNIPTLIQDPVRVWCSKPLGGGGRGHIWN